MNAAEARKIIVSEHDYKFACRLVPPMIALAEMSTGISHAKIGIKYGLVAVDFNADQPYKIKEPNNFKAGKLKLGDDGTVKLSGFSTDFNKEENVFASDADLQDLFATADIQILT